MSTDRRKTPGARGFTLAEVLVAMAVFTIIFLAALLIYDRSNRMFSQDTQAADMQQNTRVAYEKLVQDLRLAGFDYKRAGAPTSAYPVVARSAAYVVGQMVLPIPNNGHIYKCTTTGTTSSTVPSSWSTTSGATVTDGTVVWTESGSVTSAFDQPDEQIEYAWSSAITVRANYDYDIPNDSAHYDHGRESAYETAQFPVVTTGNHEIVTYALHSDKPGAANGDSVTFYADVNNGGSPSRTAYPGGNPERLITISNVDLSNNNPPYTLYRYTLADDGSVVSTPLASNIRSLNFQYWEDKPATQPLKDFSATPVAITNVGGGDQYDPSDPTTLNGPNRRIRAKIRAITVTLVGMNSNQDFDYNDGDTLAPHYRKMTLATTIVGRNLGVVPLPQNPVQPPPKPINVTVCYGYCGVANIGWTPGSGSTGAESYSVAYDTSSGGDFSNFFPAGTLTNFALDMTQVDKTVPYYFKVWATNGVGSTPSDVVGSVSIQNATKPSVPTNFVASVSTSSSPISGKVNLSWTAPTTNATGSPSCTTGTTTVNTIPAELMGYRIYRGTTSGFDADSGSLIADENSPGFMSDGAGNWFYTDTTVSNCVDYYYRIRAIEWCAAAGNQNTSGNQYDGISHVTPSSSSPGVHGFASSGAVPMAPASLAVVSATCATAPATPNLCTPINLSWAKVTTDTLGNALNITQYEVYRTQKKSAAVISGPTLADTVTTTAGAGTVSWAEPSATLAAYDPADNVKYTYEYYVVATSCSLDSAHSNVVSVPAAACTTSGVVSASGGTGGSGTSASPYVGATLISVGGATFTSVMVSIDGGAYTAVSGSPFQVPWTDSADYTVHTFTFEVSTATCTNEVLPTFYIQNSAPSCSAGLTLANPTATTVTLTLTNTATEALNLQGIDITWGGQSKLNWTSLKAPSTTAITPAPVCSGSSACSASFTTSTLGASSDKSIPVSGGGSLVYTMGFTISNGNPTVSSANVTGVTVHYTRISTGSLTFDCVVK